MGGIDAQEFLADSSYRVAGDVEREQPWRADSPSVVQQHQRRREREVPDQLIQERRLEGGVLLIAGGGGARDRSRVPTAASSDRRTALG